MTFVFFNLLNSTLAGAVKISIIRKLGLVHSIGELQPLAVAAHLRRMQIRLLAPTLVRS